MKRYTIRNSSGFAEVIANDYEILIDDSETTFTGKAIERLAELEDKIEQGTLIELPCPIRTMVYYIASYEKKNGFFGEKKYCTTIMEILFELDMLDSYGNNWFLTREEAEKRLKELQNGM